MEIALYFGNRIVHTYSLSFILQHRLATTEGGVDHVVQQLSEGLNRLEGSISALLQTLSNEYMATCQPIMLKKTTCLLFSLC
jgi:hypothetical protein